MEHHSAASIFHHLVSYPRDVRETCRDFLAETRQSIRAAYAADGWLHRGAFLLILAIAIAIRVWFAATRAMTYDESWTFIGFASQPFRIALSNYSTTNNHLLNTAMIRVSYLLFGISPLTVRLPALISGVLSIPAAYILFRGVYNKNVALFAAGLVAASSFLIEYAAEARGYSFVTLCFLILLILADVLRRRWNTFVTLACAVVATLMVYCVLVGIYPAVITAAWILLSLLIERRFAIAFVVVRDCVIASLLTIVMTGLLYLPVVLGSGLLAVTRNWVVRPLDWRHFVAFNLSRQRDTWADFNATMPVVVGVAILVAFGLALILNRRISASKVPIAGVTLIVLSIMVFIQRVAPYSRVLLFLLPVYLGTAAAGFVLVLNLLGRHLSGRIWESLMAAVPVLTTVSLGAAVYQQQITHVWGFNDTITLSAEQIALVVGKQIRNDDAILTLVNDFPSIRFYIIEHYGFSAGEYANWTQISNGRVVPQRLFIVLVRKGQELQGSPEDIISARGLDPADYDISPQPVLVGDVAIFTANRKG